MFPVRAGEAVVNNLLQISGTTLDMQVCTFSEDGNLCIITQIIHLKEFRSATTSIGEDLIISEGIVDANRSEERLLSA